MADQIKELGKVKLVQVQPNGLIIDTPNGDIYDATRRVEVNRLLITHLGIEAVLPTGEPVLDIHHINHPDKAYKDDLISIGFTSHYAAMRERFGKHMQDGTAGENIIIETDREIWLDDLGQQVVIKSAETGGETLLDILRIAKPCNEFSHFAAKSQHQRLPADELKSTLQFLNNGRRGFLLALADGQESVTVQAGDRVFAMLS
ncbi:MAG TPA: MOSC domain-containing protein [Anaerolineales bacterium]|nr:MOSC domain-containing protein [Anaerolineales bacterium]